jgi:hypothetical protein
VSQIWRRCSRTERAKRSSTRRRSLAAVGVIAVGSGLRSRMPAGWEIVSWVTATALVLGTLLRFFSLEAKTSERSCLSPSQASSSLSGRSGSRGRSDQNRGSREPSAAA